MTSLNWIYQDKSVHLACDTLVMTVEDRQPLCFSTKIHPIVHARTLLAGTGDAQFLAQVAFTVSTSSICRHAPDVDRGLAAELADIYARIDSGVPSTIYAFGWDERRRCMLGFAYRSGDGFASESLPIGLGMKPPVTLGERSIEPIEPFLVELALRQRAAEAGKHPAESVDIGGEIILARLTEDELVMKTIHRFSDYPDMLNAATAHLAAPS